MNKCKDCGHEQATWKGRLCEECQAHESRTYTALASEFEDWGCRKVLVCYSCGGLPSAHRREQFTYVSSNVIVS